MIQSTNLKYQETKNKVEDYLSEKNKPYNKKIVESITRAWLDENEEDIAETKKVISEDEIDAYWNDEIRLIVRETAS